jgi:hypothetical protein
MNKFKRGDSMGNKKFMIYKIKIVFGNGDIEYRNGDDTYSPGNYSDMCELFKTVQKEVWDQDCKVVLLGVDYRGNNTMLKERNFTKPSIEEQQIYETSFVEYANQIRDILEKMRVKRDYHTQMLDAVEKKNSIIDHRIETFSKKEWSNQEEMMREKMSIFDESEQIKKDRRLHKDELELIHKIRDNIDLIEAYEAFDIKPKNIEFKYLDQDLARSLGMIKEIYYSNDKDRVTKVKKYKKMYSSVRIDYKNNKLICYNKAANAFK